MKKVVTESNNLTVVDTDGTVVRDYGDDNETVQAIADAFIAAQPAPKKATKAAE